IREDIVPTVISVNQLTDIRLYTLVQFNNVEFLSNYEGLSYAIPNDIVCVARTLNDCYNHSVIVRNSCYANVKDELLPTGNGSLIAVAGVFNGTYQLVIRDTEDIDFEGERCPENARTEGLMPFEESFSTHPTGAESYLDLPGW